MGGYGRLATTGMAPLTVAGVALHLPVLFGLGVALVVLGALSLRLSWRRGRSLENS